MGSCQSKTVSITDIPDDKHTEDRLPLKRPDISPIEIISPNESPATPITTNDEHSHVSSDDKSTSVHSQNRGCSALNGKDKNIKRSTSIVGLDTMIETRKEEGDLRSNVVHIEVPFGKPIEEVYDGVHDGEVLGSGISGIVRLCTHKKTTVKYAVKCLDLGLIGTCKALEQLREEIYIMCQLDHPNIVRLEEVYESPNEIYLVMELCMGGELFDRLDEQPEYHYTEQQCARLVKQMLNAVRYIHSKGIVHRDLKLENFLFTSSDPGSELKMIDFGLSKHFDIEEELHEAVGTPYTVAPEVILGEYNESCDVWAIGVITYLLLSGDPPFGGCGGPETLMQVRENITTGSYKFEPREIWDTISQQAKDFINSLLVLDPKKRLKASKAQQSKWLKEWAVKDTIHENNLINPNVVKALVMFKEYSDMHKLLCEVLSFTLFPDQIKDLRKEFEKLDKDGSGEITLATLKKVLMESAGAGSLGALTEEEVEDIFNAMRVRKNETTIQWHEFIAAGLSQCEVDDRNLRLAFDRLDSDHKGYITLENVIDLLGSDGKKSESIRKMYFDGLKDCKCRHYTRINSAEIYYDDFLILMKGQSNETFNQALTTAGKSSLLEVVHETPEGENWPTDEDDVTESLKARKSSKNISDKPLASAAIEDFEKDEAQQRIMVSTDSRRCVALPEHDHSSKELDDLIKDESKTPLKVNRNLYRAHRQMRLAVLEASKQFEEEQMKRVFQEQAKKTNMGRVGAGLVMKHGETKQISTEEVREILRKRQEEQQGSLDKATKQSGRGKKRRQKTVSDMSGMLAEPAVFQAATLAHKKDGGSCPSSPFINKGINTIYTPNSLPFLPLIDLGEPACTPGETKQQQSSKVSQFLQGKENISEINIYDNLSIPILDKTKGIKYNLNPSETNIAAGSRKEQVHRNDTI